MELYITQKDGVVLTTLCKTIEECHELATSIIKNNYKGRSFDVIKDSNEMGFISQNAEIWFTFTKASV